MPKTKGAVDRGLEFVREHTFQLKERLWMENLARNMPRILGGRDIRELPKCDGSAVVVGAGPSVGKYGHLKLLKESGYGGTVIATDRMLKPCLKGGITPTIVCSVDGDRTISGFYTDISEPKAALNVIVHPDVAEFCHGNDYWFMTPVDDPFAPRSVTRAVHLMTRKTILSSFGNVGGQAVNLAMFLGADPVILVGLDYGYPPDTPLGETSYYSAYAELAKRRREKLENFFTRIKNPETGEEVILDMNWATYREIFLRHMRMVRGKSRVINCSPTSTLFGGGIESMPLEEALEKWPR